MKILEKSYYSNDFKNIFAPVIRGSLKKTSLLAHCQVKVNHVKEVKNCNYTNENVSNAFKTSLSH